MGDSTQSAGPHGAARGNRPGPERGRHFTNKRVGPPGPRGGGRMTCLKNPMGCREVKDGGAAAPAEEELSGWGGLPAGDGQRAWLGRTRQLTVRPSGPHAALRHGGSTWSFRASRTHGPPSPGAQSHFHHEQCCLVTQGTLGQNCQGSRARKLTQGPVSPVREEALTHTLTVVAGQQ